MADTRSPITYSCYYSRNRSGEQFVPEHVLSYQISGTLTVNNGDKDFIFNEGDFRFVRRNQLLKFIKQPPPDGVFKSVSIYLDQVALQNFSRKYGQNAGHSKTTIADPVIQLSGDSFLKAFMDSLIPYIEGDQPADTQLEILKQCEAIMLLMRAHPELKDILFDFSEPGKIDLEAFMNKNFHFNVHLNRFAYLTGRSLATFKRDFEHIFHTSPSRWLQQRRLQEAYFMLKEQGKTASDVYLDVGFEDLSHFSFAFKKAYGVPPSKIAG